MSPERARRALDAWIRQMADWIVLDDIERDALDALERTGESYDEMEAAEIALWPSIAALRLARDLEQAEARCRDLEQQIVALGGEVER